MKPTDITKWKFNHYPWLRQLMEHGTQKVIVWRIGQSLGKTEEVIKGVFTLPRH